MADAQSAIHGDGPQPQQDSHKTNGLHYTDPASRQALNGSADSLGAPTSGIGSHAIASGRAEYVRRGPLGLPENAHQPADAGSHRHRLAGQGVQRRRALPPLSKARGSTQRQLRPASSRVDFSHTAVAFSAAHEAGPSDDCWVWIASRIDISSRAAGAWAQAARTPATPRTAIRARFQVSFRPFMAGSPARHCADGEGTVGLETPANDQSSWDG